MSKRAEEAALEAYPYNRAITDNDVEYDGNFCNRLPYTEGYEQAEKDTIERVVAWLKDNAEKYIVQTTESYPDAPFKAIIGGKCWKDLKKAMKEAEK